MVKRAYGIGMPSRLRGVVSPVMDALLPGEKPIVPISRVASRPPYKPSLGKVFHDDIPGVKGRSDPAWKSESGKEIGGKYGLFYRNTDPSVPLGEFFFRKPGGGLGATLNIPGNKNLTREDARRIAQHISFNMPEVAKTMSVADIERGIMSHVLGNKTVGPVKKMLGFHDHFDTYDLNIKNDKTESFGAALSDIIYGKGKK